MSPIGIGWPSIRPGIFYLTALVVLRSPRWRVTAVLFLNSPSRFCEADTFCFGVVSIRRATSRAKRSLLPETAHLKTVRPLNSWCPVLRAGVARACAGIPRCPRWRTRGCAVFLLRRRRGFGPMGVKGLAPWTGLRNSSRGFNSLPPPRSLSAGSDEDLVYLRWANVTTSVTIPEHRGRLLRTPACRLAFIPRIPLCQRDNWDNILLPTGEQRDATGGCFQVLVQRWCKGDLHLARTGRCRNLNREASWRARSSRCEDNAAVPVQAWPPMVGKKFAKSRTARILPVATLDPWPWGSMDADLALVGTGYVQPDNINRNVTLIVPALPEFQLSFAHRCRENRWKRTSRWTSGRLLPANKAPEGRPAPLC